MTDQAIPATAAATTPTLWRNAPYQLLMWGGTFQVVGVSLGLFVAPLIAYALTGSLVLSGTIAAIGQVGALVATLPAGVVVDRVDRRRLIVAGTSVGAALWLTIAVAAVAGVLSPWHLGAVLFIESVLTVFLQPAESSAVREVVSAEQMGTAMSVSGGRQAVAALIGGPLGGVLYGISAAVPLFASAVGYAAAGVAAALVRQPLNGDLSTAKEEHPIAQLREGLAVVWRVPVLRFGVFLAGGINFAFGGVFVALNLYLVSIGTDPWLIGVVDAVAGAAMVVGSVIAPAIVNRVPAGRILAIGLGVATVGLVGLALATEYWMYLAAMAVTVILIPAINASLGGYISAIVPSRLQGRVKSTMGLTTLVAIPAASTLGAVGLELLGVHGAMFAFAALEAVMVAASALVGPVRRIGTPDTWAGDAIEPAEAAS